MDITTLSNRRMISLKDKLQPYNYQIKHVAGKRNSIADSLSRVPEWFKNSKPTDDLNFVIEEGILRVLVTGQDTQYINKINTYKALLLNNPNMDLLEEIGRKDDDYTYLVGAIRTSLAHKSLSASSEGAMMGGEWEHLELLEN